jgi:hypothetical protein
MIDTNTKDIPAMGHMLWLRIEVPINGLRDDFNIGFLATFELCLDFLWQCHLMRELPPAPISTSAILWGRSLGVGRWAMKVCSFKGLPTICRNFNPADATATTRPGHSLDFYGFSIVARNLTMIWRRAQNALNWQGLNHGALFQLDLAAIFVAHLLWLPSRDLLTGNVNTVSIPADIRSKVAIKFGTRPRDSNLASSERSVLASRS